MDRQFIIHSGHIKKGGGIIVYVKEGIDVRRWPDLDVSDGDLECVSLTCKQGMHRNINLTCVYRPPSGRIQSALDRLESIVIRSTTSGDCVVMGDFNIDLLVDNLHTRKLKQFANSCSLRNVIFEPTILTTKSETLIDHIYCNAPHVSLAGTVECNITDHLPFFFVLKKTKTRLQYREIYARSFRDFERESFATDIRHINFEEAFSESEPD